MAAIAQKTSEFLFISHLPCQRVDACPAVILETTSLNPRLSATPPLPRFHRLRGRQVSVSATRRPSLPRSFDCTLPKPITPVESPVLAKVTKACRDLPITHNRHFCQPGVPGRDQDTHLRGLGLNLCPHRLTCRFHLQQHLLQARGIAPVRIHSHTRIAPPYSLARSSTVS